MHARDFCSAGDSPILDFLANFCECVQCAKSNSCTHDLWTFLYVNYTIKVYQRDTLKHTNLKKTKILRTIPSADKDVKQLKFHLQLMKI